MLPSLQRSRSGFGLLALLVGLLINISLAGVIYALTLGTNKPPQPHSITINFRQFTDSSVTAQEMLPEQTALAEPSPQPQMTAIAAPAQPVMNVDNIASVSAISLPVIAVPTFASTPQFVDVTRSIQPQADVMTGADVAQAALGEPDIGLAKVLRKTDPVYPYKAKRLKIEGYVLLHVLIDDSGRAQQIKIIEEQPRGYFAKVTRNAVRRWQFEHAPAGTQVWKQWRVAFELN